MSDFSDRPFVAGSLVGLRAFSVDSLGRLVGPSYGGVFKPGENVAACNATRPSLPAGARLEWQTFPSAMWSDWPGTDHNLYTVEHRDGTKVTYKSTEALLEDYPSEEHAAGATGCTCGYYAYFDGRNDYHHGDHVAAVVEGYGTCTLGTRGFRAEKARLLAIIDPTVRRWWQSWKFSAAWALICSLFAINSAVGDNWVFASIHALLVGINTWTGLFNYRASRRVAGKNALIRRNYPDVPRFRTTKEALKAFPLTPPPEPTPETDDNFWTRSAS